MDSYNGKKHKKPHKPTNPPHIHSITASKSIFLSNNNDFL